MEATQLCNCSLLSAKIVAMNEDSTNVNDVCSDRSKTDPCCLFLDIYNFFSLPCVYTQTRFIIQKVVNSTDTPTNGRIFQTILQCVNRTMSSSITTPGQHDRNGKTSLYDFSVLPYTLAVTICISASL